MKDILLQAFSFFLIIIAGYLLKRIGWLGKADGTLLSIIILNVTLPAAIFTSLATVQVSSIFFLLILTAIVVNAILVLAAKFLWKKKKPLDQAFLMYCISGYNIGNFSLPFIQGFFPIAVPFLCMFDIGNSFMISGGTIILVDRMTGLQKEPPTFLEIVKRLSRSIPFMTYVLIFFLKLFSINFSSDFLQIIQLPAGANGFLSMLMIGLYLELKLPKNALQLVGKILGLRYLFGGLLAIIFYFFIPFPELVKIVLVLLSLAPLPTFAVINSVTAGVPEETAGFISSASILISLCLMTIIMLSLV